jgi:hypothetical protein
MAVYDVFAARIRALRSKDQGCKNVGGVSRGRRSRPRRTEPWRRFSAGTHTGLLDAVGRGFMPFFIPVKIFYFIYPSFHSFYSFIVLLQNIFNKKMQAARHKLPDNVYSKEFTSFMPETPLR